jgi:HEAT repeat protein
MVAELLNNADRDMRALGLQQVREAAPGEAATKRFAELLPKLPDESQAGLVEALGERGDAAARPAVLPLVRSDQELVRVAAIRALGLLGTEADVPVLAARAGVESAAERNAVRQSLVRLRGEQVHAAISAAIQAGDPHVRAELLAVLAARNAKEALPVVLRCAADPEPTVRLAAIDALRFMADEQQVGELIRLVRQAKEGAERRKAELALMAVCGREHEKCVEAVAASLTAADGPTRIVLLQTLGRAGGPAALEAVAGRLRDEDEAVRDEVMRVLSVWPDTTVVPRLKQIAADATSLRYHILAVRGLVRLANPQSDRPADLGLLTEAMQLAQRPQEKHLVLGVLSSVATPESLAIVLRALDDPALAEEAGLAATTIAEGLADGDKATIRAAMRKVLDKVQTAPTRERAQKLLGTE